MTAEKKTERKEKKEMLSVVIPAHNEERNIRPLYDGLIAALSHLPHDFEIIIIDDGSTDATFHRIKEIHEKDSRLRAIRFRRNFGQTAALDAGFKTARGSIIVAMDADLQNDPQDIPRLLEKLSQGYDIVSGWRYHRKDPFGKKIVSKLANTLRKSLTGERIHDSGCSLKAYRKECFEGINLYGEMHRFIPALLLWRGFRIGEIKVRHHPRCFGKTKYGLGRIMHGFLDLLIVVFWQRYSTAPIQLFGGLGLISFLVGGILSWYLFIQKFIFNVALSGRPALLLATLLVILGVQLMMFGVLADIAIKNYFKDTPTYGIKETL